MDFGCMAQKTATIFLTRMFFLVCRDFRTRGHGPERTMHAMPGFLATGSSKLPLLVRCHPEQEQREQEGCKRWSLRGLCPAQWGLCSVTEDWKAAGRVCWAVTALGEPHGPNDFADFA